MVDCKTKDMKTKIFLFILVIILFSCSKNDIGYNADYKYDTLIINNTKDIPFISTKEEIYNLLGAPKKIRSDMTVNLLENDKWVKYNSIHHIWDNYYYIEVNKELFLNSIFFKNNKDIKLIANDDIILNKKTRLSFIKREFPDSYNDRFVISHYVSSYYPDDLKDDLIFVPFVTKYGVIELVFYKNKLYYMETSLIAYLNEYKNNGSFK